MSFSAITSRSNGQTIDQSWFNLLKTAGVELETFFAALRASQSFTININGRYGEMGAAREMMVMNVPRDIEIISAKLTVWSAGSTGTTQVDMLRKRGAGSFESLFSTQPAIPSTAGNFADSDTGTGATAAVLDNTKTALEAADILKFVQTTAQSGGEDGWYLDLGYTVTGAQ